MGDGSNPSGLSMAINNPGSSMGFSPGGAAHNVAQQQTWGVQSTMPPPPAAGGFLDSLTFGQQYAIGAGFEGLTKGIAAFSKSRAEKESFEWKAEIFRRNAELKQRQIDDLRKVGKEKEAELLRKYKLAKMKHKPGGRKGTNILAGAGSALDTLMGLDILEAEDVGVLSVNVEKDIYAAKVGKWSDDVSARMYEHRAAQTSPMGDMATTMLSSAASSGMKYWKYKNSMPSLSMWSRL